MFQVTPTQEQLVLMKIIRLFFSLLLTYLLFTVLNNKFADLPYLKNIKPLQNAPVLGPFINPFGGFWTNAEPKEISKDTRLEIQGIKTKVDIFFDERLVPHIFAESEEDLYFAQGYITAKHRLWQMEFQTHAAAGRLAEILGPGPNNQILKYDRRQRRIGMLYAAEKATEVLENDPLISKIMQDYTRGVNAYIQELAPKDYPLEYKLLGYSPEPWTPLKTALLLKYMSKSLNFQNRDLKLTQLLYKYGPDVIKQWFAGFPKNQIPIIPSSAPQNYKALDLPRPPKELSAPAESFEEEEKAPDLTGIGSNNWAVGAEKSATGYPILENDPHLSLNLPSLWYEVQLVAPKLNVYGASLPGAPGVILGFNQNIAWGATNVGADVLDWYKIKFKDETKKEYLHGEEWKPISIRVEEIKIKGQETLYDSVLFTHHGPIAALPKDSVFIYGETPIGAALKWIVHEPSNELLTFYKLNRAENYRDYRRALSTYTSPAQNFIFADNKKDIAITSAGKYPLRWKGQGKFVLDGSNPEHDWSETYIPFSQVPHVRNPESGYIASANQFPANDSVYPYYLDWNFAPYERAQRINERLSQMQEATTDSLLDLQNDVFSILGRDVLPLLLSHISEDSLNKNEIDALAKIKSWNYQYEARQSAPTIFNVWWRKLSQAIWEDEFGGFIYPSRDRTLNFILKNDSLPQPWIENEQTPEEETLPMLIQLSFKETVQELNDKFGALGDSWNWANYHPLNINHLIPNLGIFSKRNLVSPGDASTVNAINRTKGPSWRMIVALGQRPKARVIYPGGQSGNPGSHYYDNFIEDWLQGKLADALVFRSLGRAQNSDKIIGRIKLQSP